MSERKLDKTDYHLVKAVLTDMVSRLKRSKRKAMYEIMDVEAAMRFLYQTPDAYIVHNYLVVYEIAEPWYASPGSMILSEILVLKLAVSGDKDFSVVPAFLERKAREAGCKLAAAGTALAKADSALASLYIRSGFQPGAITLIKELDGRTS